MPEYFSAAADIRGEHRSTLTGVWAPALPKPEPCSERVVDLAAACNLNNEDQNLVVVDICEDPVVAHLIPPEVLVHELLAERAWIIKAGKFLLNKNSDALRYRRIDFSDLLCCLRSESDRVAHAGQTTSSRSMASSLD